MSHLKKAKSRVKAELYFAHQDLKTHFKEGIKDYPDAKIMTPSNKALLFLGGVAALAAVLTTVNEKTDVLPKTPVELHTYIPPTTEQPIGESGIEAVDTLTEEQATTPDVEAND